MSEPRYCGVWKATDGKYYMDLADHGEPDMDDDEDYYGPLGTYEDCTTYGPFDTSEKALEYLDNFSNPGSFFTDDAGKTPPPTKSPNGKPVQSPRRSRWGGFYETIERRFGPPLMTEGFGTPVDNKILRVGIEDEREQADQEPRPNMFWSNFQKNKPVTVRKKG